MSLRTVRRNVPVTPRLKRCDAHFTVALYAVTVTGKKNSAPLIEDGQVQGSSLRGVPCYPCFRRTHAGRASRTGPQSGGGAVAMIPKNGSSGISLPPGHNADVCVAGRFSDGWFHSQ